MTMPTMMPMTISMRGAVENEHCFLALNFVAVALAAVVSVSAERHRIHIRTQNQFRLGMRTRLSQAPSACSSFFSLLLLLPQSTPGNR